MEELVNPSRNVSTRLACHLQSTREDNTPTGPFLPRKEARAGQALGKNFINSWVVPELENKALPNSLTRAHQKLPLKDIPRK